jgi:hypothetical protein
LWYGSSVITGNSCLGADSLRINTLPVTAGEVNWYQNGNLVNTVLKYLNPFQKIIGTNIEKASIFLKKIISGEVRCSET